ncbi:MAG: hypothetical protein AAGD05_03450 [Bacteroidota bacterium]
MCLDADHQLWVGMRASLGKFAGNADSLEIIDVSSQIRPGSSSYLNAIKYVYPDPIHEDMFHSFPFPQAFKELTAIAEYDGWIWAQVENGFLMKIKSDELDRGIVETIDLKAAIAQGRIQLINDDAFDSASCLSGTFDRLGRLWFLSGKGLYC